ncbi:putative sigma-54 modulation protein [Salegentibacter holothuriorum]|uniref:Putative sigma-54 modulation protein n=1 Tax=Salegentibacter holothuriorum TaxID=241145 RepID=A0A1T5AB35_9FLAO|nr:HPF/RaiA family ribosome-associated protein [Salegentibacter holothuriorum]SKB32231.1 putative sigma-54 modulation protein [Salegentibacter holothuriorum]
MEAIYQFVKLEKSESLQEFAQKKLDKLEVKYDFIVRAEVYFKKQEGQDPNGYICNIKLSVPGPQLFAESNENSYEAATAETVKDLDRQLAKKKSQMKTHAN